MNNRIESCLGENLKKARLSRGVSQEELGKRVGISANYISQIETSRKAPSLATLWKIANELDVSPSDLLGKDPLIISLKELRDKFGLERLLAEMSTLAS